MVEDSLWFFGGVVWRLDSNGKVDYPHDSSTLPFVVKSKNVKNWLEFGHNRIVRKGLASWE